MRLTGRKLKRMVKEEINRVLSEGWEDVADNRGGGKPRKPGEYQYGVRKSDLGTGGDAYEVAQELVNRLNSNRFEVEGSHDTGAYIAGPSRTRFQLRVNGPSQDFRFDEKYKMSAYQETGKFHDPREDFDIHGDVPGKNTVITSSKEDLVNFLRKFDKHTP